MVRRDLLLPVLLTTQSAEPTQLRRLAVLPASWLAVLALGACGLLLVPVKLPVGGFYWDVDLYLNAAHRFALGQYPHVDYFSPVGAISLGLFAAVLRVFPNGHPVLLAQWSILLITLPLFWAQMREVQVRSRMLAAALVLPFLVFSFLPYNINEYVLSQAPDAFGIYNRQIALLLYVLMTSIIWGESRSLQMIVCATCLCAVTFIKITGAFPAGIFIVYGVLSGRLDKKVLVVSLAALFGLALLLELSLGMMSAFVADLIKLARLNSGSLLFHVVTSTARQFDTLLIFAAIILVSVLRGTYRAWDRSDRRLFLAKALASDAAWIVVATSGSVLYESQNTGSIEFVYLWPLWVRVFINGAAQGTRMAYLLGVLIAVANVPSVTSVVQRAARASVQGLTLVSLPPTQLDGIGRITIPPSGLQRARFLLDHYPHFPAAYQDLSAHGEMQTADLFAKADFQTFYLLSVDQAVKAIRAFETARGQRLQSYFTLDFVDPLSRLLDSRPPRFVSLAIDPRRTFPSVDAAALREMAGIDALVVPLCPALPDRDAIAVGFAAAMAGRERIQVSPCWQLLLRSDLAAKKPAG